MFDFSGKTVLITGATGGIGRELCTSFLKNQARIILTGTNKERLETLKNDLGNNCKTFKCNLANIEELNELLKYLDDLGGIDILVIMLAKLKITYL